MTSTFRLTLSASGVLAAALLVAGCASSPGAPTSTSEPEPDQTSAATAPAPSTDDDFEAAWLDNGRMFAVVTLGSSSCVPTVEAATAEGQNVTVELNEGDLNQACTDDLVPRASLGMLPEGVDPTKDVELIVTLGDITDDIDLDGNTALTKSAGTETDSLPSAGWFDDDGIVLLTWGSSSCPPVIDSVQASGRTATVTFVESADRVCTMDMAARTTIITFADEDDLEDDAFELPRVGDNLDAAIPVVED